MQTLHEHRRSQLEERLFIGPAYDDQNLVFAGPTGSVWDDSNLRKGFQAAAKRAGLSGVRVHDLRHTMATLMLRASIHPKIVSDRLGHASVSITLDTYSHVVPDMGRDAAEALQALIRRPVEAIG